MNRTYCLIGCLAALAAAAPASAQETAAGDEEILVTGSRIRQSPLETSGPVVTLSSEDLEKAGVTSVADVLMRLTASGGALNTRFNSSGNFGYPPDGGGVGAGSAQVDLRHLGAKRVLVLVDGIRWVNESSASGVGSATDLNTIPVSIIDRVEVLEEGASAIYGSDAIAGVVNIITKKSFDGLEVSAYGGSYDLGDGDTSEYALTLGAGGEQTTAVFNISYTRQQGVSAADVPQAQESNGPGTTNHHGSSATPQGRYAFGDVDCTTNDGAVPAPGETALFFDPNNPCNGDDFHPFGLDDRFNFAPFNYVVTPSERTGVFGQATHELTENMHVYARGLYNNRKSANQAAPTPLFIGSEAGNGNLLDTIGVDATNPYNPFGVTIPAEGSFLTRRPLEGGPRIFEQDVDTWYLGAGLEGDFEAADRHFFWDVNGAWSRNAANQIKFGDYNSRRLKDALGPAFQENGEWFCGTPGDPIPGCVPFNFFGGQGANGEGTITKEMLDYVGFVEQDTSEQELLVFTANLSGSIVELPAGDLAFATGIEHRELDGFFQPDAIIVAGESSDVPASPTSGGYDVDEIFGELNIPLIAGKPGADLLEVNIAARNSDYSTSGGDTTTRFGVRWRPTSSLLLRATVAEGLRAPSIGELFGTQSRFDATIADPCSDFNNSGVPQSVIDNCIAEGVPADGSYVQSGGQISVLTGGNPDLQPETADSNNFGLVYSPAWLAGTNLIEAIDFEVNYYEHELDGAIQAVDAQTILTSCGTTGADNFCDLIGRTPLGTINRFDNQLTNIGGIDTNGWDFNVTYTSPVTEIGQFLVDWRNTFLSEYTEILLDPSSPSGFTERSLEGIEEADRGRPEWKFNLALDWLYQKWSARWTMRWFDELTEACSDFLDGVPGESLTELGVCSEPDFANNSLSRNKLDSTMFNDVQVTYTAFDGQLALTGGVNNVLDEDPPACYSCSLNGYDPSIYDVPGRFYYLRAVWHRTAN
jgi:iron complex outermembrane receptor protein